MSEQTQQLDPIYSSLGSDPDLGELVEMFVAEMPHRVGTLLRAFDEGNLELLGRHARQLKSSAGGYGFDEIMPRADRLEIAARSPAGEEEIRRALQQLVDLCNRCRAGVPT